MRPNLRSVIAQVTRGGPSAVCRRNFSGSAGNNGTFSELKGNLGWRITGKILIQGLSLAAGYGLGRFVVGDCLAEVEATRQDMVRKIRGDSEEIVDLREKMWSDLRESTWSYLQKKVGSLGKF